MKTLLWRTVHLLVLATLAISQPLLGILGENPTFFTAHSSSPGQIVVFAVITALAPAVLLSAAMLAGHARSERFGQHIFQGAMTALTFLFVIQVVDVIGGLAWLVFAVAIACTYGLMTLYVRHERVRSAVSVLAVLPPVVVAYFLFVSPANSVVFPDEVEAVTLETLLGADLDDLSGPSDQDRRESAVTDQVAPADGSTSQDESANAADSPDTTEQVSLVERLNNRFPPIYLLVFDELPWHSLLDEAGQIDSVRYPNFARLGETSHVFNNATTDGFTTELAVPALLASTLEPRAAPVYSMYPDNLFTLLGGVYDVSSWDPLVDLCPDSVCNGSAPERVLELLALDTIVSATTTVAPAITVSASPTTNPTSPTRVATTSTPAPLPELTDDETGGGNNSSLSLLLQDAAIVFGHLVAPEGMDLGLPSIGAGWGNFGGGLTTTAPAASTSTTTTTTTTAQESTPTTEATPTTTQATATTSTSLSSDTSQTKSALDIATEAEVTTGTDPVDPERIAAERTAFLDSLISLDTRVFDFRREVAAIGPLDLPRLHYLHALLPHVPWRLRPDGSSYADIGLPGYFSKWDNDRVKALFGQQRHLLQLGFADHLLGEYLDRLEAIGDLDRAMLIVTADHGVSFVAGERSRGVNEVNVGGIAGVPLLFKEPGQRTGTVQAQPVRLVDIVPTIAALLEVEVPWAVAGQDMFRPQAAPDRAVGGTGGSVKVPENFTTITDELAADMHEVFGDGHSGSLYGLGGAHHLIGTRALDNATESSAHCWVYERPTSIPEADGSIGYVFGLIDAPPTGPIAFAIVVDGVVAGTARSFGDGPPHRVFAIGDSQYWRGADPVVELHEIVNSRLAPIPACAG
ncbi:MAG: sulfatase-like hydrolase/transferase [Acidimicrobiaceae bacterium]|nr:sulfatase-like hydrolase/transferase [Acidimicrobiaceae bacterium]MYD06150.1 sulfatase-like hydrolase/transferase [Acidimicrobiaceae bacterium]MYI57899.1 sulfatase-like hydrolase/transferase [Acidimicrobiaceae bacterium]